MKINISFLEQEFLIDIKKTGEENLIETPLGEFKLEGYFKDGLFYLINNEKEIPVYFYLEKDILYIHFEGKVWEFKRKEKKFEESHKSDKFDGKIYPPMPGNVVKVMVKDGEEVEKGTPLIILESMKMEHTIFSPVKGKIKKVYAIPQTVAELSKPLIEIEDFSN